MREHDEERLFQAIATAARRIPAASPDLDARIMAAVRAASEPRRRRVIAWLTAPRTIRMSPVAGLAYAAGLVIATFVGASMAGIRMPSPPASERPYSVDPSVDAASRDIVQTVQFVLVAPEAATVALVGDFNQWSLATTLLRPTGVNGVWTVDVPLPAGRHEYAFVIDGTRWVPDPAAPRAPMAEFGTPNSVITINRKLS